MDNACDEKKTGPEKDCLGSLRKVRLASVATAVGRTAIISVMLTMLPGCVVVGGYSSERGWFVWPGTFVILLVVLLVLFLRRRK